MKCQYSKTCKLYDKDSVTCNLQGDTADSYCGAYKDNSNHKKHHRKPILALSICLILLIALVLLLNSVSATDFDNIISNKEIKQGDSFKIGEKDIPYNEVWKDYKPIEISNAFNLPVIGTSLYKDALTTHSYNCGGDNNCLDIWEAELNIDSALVDNLEFKRLVNEVWQDGNVRWYKLYYWGTIEDYETTCKIEKEVIDKNGTSYIPKTCEEVKIGSHEDWIEFKVGDIFKKGTYKVKLEADKRPDYIIDYIPTILGKKISSRAVWGVGGNISSGLVSQYKLNDNNYSIITDNTGSNNGTGSGKTFNHGTPVNGVNISDGAMSFDGVNDYVNISSSIGNFSRFDNFTLNSWFYPRNNLAGTYILAKRTTGSSAGYYLIQGVGGNNNQLQFVLLNSSSSGSYTTTSNTYNLNTWNFVSVNYNNFNLTINLNGISSSSIYTETGDIINNINLGIGVRVPAPTTLPFNGSIDDVEIYSRALSPTEITAQYNLGRGKYAIDNTGLVAQYSGRDFLNTTSNPTLILDTNHVTNGKVNMSVGFDGVNDYVKLLTTTINTNPSTYSFSAWINPQTNPQYKNILDFGDGNLNQRVQLYLDGTILIFKIGKSDGSAVVSTGASITPNVWSYVTAINNGTNNNLYVNGNLAQSLPIVSAWDFSANNKTIGSLLFNGGGNYIWNFNGSIDDVRIYNRSLSANEISTLYAGGHGTEEITSGLVTLNSPADGTIVYNNPQTFNCSAFVTGGAVVMNISLVKNSSGVFKINETNYGGTYGIYINETYNWGISSTWGGVVTTNGTGLGTTLMYNVSNKYIDKIGIRAGKVDGRTVVMNAYFTYNDDSLSSAVSINLPNGVGTYTEYLNPNSNKTVKRLTFNATGVDNNYAYASNISILLRGMNTVTFSKNITNAFIWSCLACDSDGECGYAENRTISRDVTAPVVSILYPTGTIPYAYLGQNISLNYSVTDLGNLSVCWYNHNGTNITTPCNNNSTIILTTNKNITIYANDSFNNVGSVFGNWDYTYFEYNQTYSATAYETSTESFYINITYNSSSYGVTAILNYDGINHTAINIGSGDNGIFLATITIPLINVSANKTLFWYINGLAGASYTQIVNPIILQLCNSTYNISSLNFTYYNEANLLPLNATANNTIIKATYDFWIGDGSIKKPYSYQNLTSTTNSFSFCISPPSLNMTIDLTMEYGATDFLDNSYELQNSVISNVTRNITLYLLPINLGTKFIHTLRRGIDFIPNTLVSIDKYFVGVGQWRNIGIRKTDNTGRFVQFLELDKNYNYTVQNDNGSIIASIENTAICLTTPCEITLQIDTASSTVFSEMEAYIAQNVIYSLTYNKTIKMVNLDFNDLTGTAHYWRMWVYKPYFGNETMDTICNITSYTVNGSMICNTTGYYGDIIARVYISRSPEVIVSFLTFLNEDRTEALGTSGLLACVLILLVIIFTASRSATGALIMIPFGLVILKFLGFLPLSWGTVVGIIVFLIIIIAKMKA